MCCLLYTSMVAVMTQTIGAGKPGIAYQARQLGLIFNAVIGVLMSVFLAVFSGNICLLYTSALQVPQAHLRPPALQQSCK